MAAGRASRDHGLRQRHRRPVQVHWGYADPSSAPEGDRKNAFELTRQALGFRMLQLLQLPLDSMSNTQLQAALADISRS